MCIGNPQWTAITGNAQVRYVSVKNNSVQANRANTQERHQVSESILWVLSDQRVHFCLDGGGSSGETRRLHKHAVARRAAEVHSALDSPVVLPCERISIFIQYLRVRKSECGLLRDSPTARSSFTPIQIPLANSTPPT